MTDTEKKFLALLQAAIQHKASDVHLATGLPPGFRTGESITSVNLAPFTREEMTGVAQLVVADPALKAKLHEIRDLDGSFEVKGLGRFRYNLFQSSAGTGLVLRVIASQIPSLESLGLPPVLRKIAEAERGLVLVTGATGSGKSTTLAAMIDHLNSNQSLHVITIEDPIEFSYPMKRSRITQREVGRDTASFAQALKSAMRQDPDVILVGELRDQETLDIALKAAETGHLVFSTVHTADAMKTIGRLLSLFPAGEQENARVRLADNLHAIISQRLLPAKSGGKAAVQEILINNLSIQECILSEKKTFEIPTFLEKGRDVSGMQTFDMHLAELAKKEVITLETATQYASNPSDFQRNLSFGESALSFENNGSSFETQMAGVEESNPFPLDSSEAPAIVSARGAPRPPTPATPSPGAPPRPSGKAPVPPIVGSSPKIPKPKAA